MRFLLVALLSLGLTACVSQDQADEKMAKGCEAAVNILLKDEGKQLSEIKVKRYADEQAEGGLHRRITLMGIEKDGWLELDKSYSCLFAQDWGLFKSSHEALLVQVQIDDQLYGKKDGVIQGTLEDFIKLTDAVHKAMGQ
ncbi:MAG TPA: hypothetical protein PLF01_01155 [Alphaproteobacteria bacterium]|nr:hypothetical protein [Alphaproteobacteria bacterium]